MAQTDVRMKNPGQHPNRRYRRLCFLAQGGMGSVELARLRSGPRYQRLFALKRPFPHLRDDPQFRNMFMDEARVAGLIRDKHVVMRD